MQAVTILVFLVLPTVLIVAGGVLAFVFLKEGFVPTATKRESTAVSRLPLLRGDSLRRWAADVSKTIMAKYSTRPWTITSAAEAAREIESEASLVIDRIVPRAPGARSSRCPDRGEGPIHVTVPEAIAIAAELRAKLPNVEVRRVLQRARDNELAAADAAGAEAAFCPLLADDGHCLVYAARPLHCRARRCPNREPSADGAAAADFSLTVSEGMREGLSAALATAGLDSQSQELNRSLIQALGT